MSFSVEGEEYGRASANVVECVVGIFCREGGGRKTPLPGFREAGPLPTLRAGDAHKVGGEKHSAELAPREHFGTADEAGRPRNHAKVESEVVGHHEVDLVRVVGKVCERLSIADAKGLAERHRLLVNRFRFRRGLENGTDEHRLGVDRAALVVDHEGELDDVRLRGVFERLLPKR